MKGSVLTQSDRLLTSEGGHPSLMDIAVGMSRQPRFGGQTRVWWSVLDHSLFCDELVKDSRMFGVPVLGSDDEMALRRWRLAVLLHDAHEALTGDVPTPLKTEDFKYMQKDMDRRIFDAYYPGGYYGADAKAREHAVKGIDVRALRAEALAFLPHATDRIVSIFGETTAEDMDTLQYYQGYSYAAQPPAGDQREHPLVKQYIERVIELL